MKPLNKTYHFLESNNFKNVIIIFGVFLSLFTITSFDSLSDSSVNTFVEDISGESKCVDNIEPVEAEVVDQTSIKNNTAKTHHNFIASYFLQESTIKRERKTSESEKDVVGHIIQLHKTIITTTLSSF